MENNEETFKLLRDLFSVTYDYFYDIKDNITLEEDGVFTCPLCKKSAKCNVVKHSKNCPITKIEKKLREICVYNRFEKNKKKE